MKKVKKYDNILYYNLSFLNGNCFYALEYFKYFIDNNLPIQLIIKTPNKNFTSKLHRYWNDKYHNIENIIDKIIFINKEKIISKNIFILDGTSILDIDKNLFTKKVLYNWGDNELSLKYSFINSKIYKELSKNKNLKIITCSDHEIPMISETDIHFPLKLNFSIFKEINEFEDNIFIEDKRDNFDSAKIFNRNRIYSNFHKTFNKLIYYKQGFYERANRLIPECKFYNKEIEFYNYDDFIDSAQLRYDKSWESYDINKDKNIKKIIKDFIC